MDFETEGMSDLTNHPNLFQTIKVAKLDDPTTNAISAYNGSSSDQNGGWPLAPDAHHSFAQQDLSL